MFRFIFIFWFLLIFNSNCFSFSKNSVYFGIEVSSFRNYFEVDLLPVNFISHNLLFLNKYKNDKNTLNQKIFSATKYFFNYLKEIKTNDFSFTKGGSFFIGYQISDYLSINFGKGYFFHDMDIKINNFSELFKNQLTNNSIGSYRYSSECKWIDLFRFFCIEKKLFLLFSFGLEFFENKFNFLSDKKYQSYKIFSVEEKKFDIKNFSSYNLLKKKVIENNLIAHTFLYKKNKKINFIKKNVNINNYKICLDHLFGINFFSNRTSIKLGIGSNFIVTSNFSVNFLFRYYFFMNDYSYIKILSKKLISTNLNFVYKI